MGLEISSLDDIAVWTHEMFSSYRRAGFSRDEALKLVQNQLLIMQPCPHCGKARSDAST